MKCLTAGDALSDRLLRVTADMHPSSGKGNGHRETRLRRFRRRMRHVGGARVPGAG